MRRTIVSLIRLVSAVLVVLSAPAAVFAAGPLAVCTPGRPYVWPAGGTNIPFNPDQGNLGPLDNAGAVALVGGAFQQWGNIPTATTTYVNAGPLPVNVDITNFLSYLEPAAPDGFSAIVFDDTGEIFEALFGPDSGVLGFAGPEWAIPATCEIIEGLAFLNGPSFGNAAEALDVLVHEFGHYQNLGHTAVNGQIVLGAVDPGFDDHSGPSPNNTFPLPPLLTLASKIETMYPFYFGPVAGTSTPNLDDVASLSTLYPTNTFAITTGAISGIILGSNGTTRLTGVNVIARNVANPFDDAVSAMSSDFALTYEQSAPFVGVYTFRGLTPGAQYAVYIDQIVDGGFSTPPRILPAAEEFYNGAHESGNGATDNPALFTAITAQAGTVVRGINILTNAFAEGAALPIGDDDAVELFMPFKFKLCGQSFDSVWVNGNGNLTFGAPSADFSETRLEFLEGPPRAAGLWDDLNPAAGGVVSFDGTSLTYTVTWTNVPEFALAGGTGSNTFSIKLHRFFDLIEVNYGAVSALDGLAGVTCGGQVASSYEMPQDLSRSGLFVELLSDPAGFEQFSSPANPFDLANKTVLYTGTINYSDRWAGSNDTPASAKRISLPFNSASVKQFTEIEKVGDVDFYRFRAKAGQILALETLTGPLDTIVGIFDPSGVLIAVNDDGGSGILSRMGVFAPSDGDYVVGVTTWPDVGFAGATETGRYVLSVQAFEGTLIAPGDDGSAEVQLDFSFRYQGQMWNSVFVNGNGNLTFGTGNTDFSESVAELLSGPPRIAPLWDDLDSTGGLVIVSEEAHATTIHFVSVPEFFSTRANNFSVRLEKGGAITMSYLGILAADGLAGITEGGGAARSRTHGSVAVCGAAEGGDDLRALPLSGSAVRHPVPQAHLQIA